jgi:peptidoglycan/LPS O-acetylase OafA/YrhL
VAVLPVILFHAGFDAFAGGYVGVDVFFVISGYLITTIILTDLERGRFSIRGFYERRARRILPALFFVMLCCVPFAWMWMVPQQFETFGLSLIAVSLFVSNILFWQTTGYFEPRADENPLLHTWSLAIEEQFYIGFPVLLLLLWRFGRSPTFWVVVVLSAFSLLLAEYGSRHHPEPNFYLLPTRAWELGAGAICAFLMHGRAPRENSLLSAIGLALVVFAIFRFVPVTLTLAGVAAFVLSVGMAVDANILIFERTKEELRSGKTLFTAIEAGFNRAWNSIFDSNVSSIITAAILFYFGSSVIRGFALVLIIGVLISDLVLAWIDPRIRYS